MGWERKRGKLLDLNKLLRGHNDSFPVRVGDLSILPKVKYVLTLDSDTQLPLGAAAKLVGTICHPLNRAIVDPVRRIVHAGYGILQPRVGVSVQSASRSRLAGLYSGQTGLDVYSNAVSDVYQDLYGEGIFTGKGLYEVNVLQQVLDRRFPRNFLLSHDLIEGFYARAGLVTDVQVIDDYPSHVSAYSPASIAGCAATGKLSGGCLGEYQTSRVILCPTRSPLPRDGKYSTICAAAWLSRQRLPSF